MLDSDIAISPASTTLMELLAVGTPSISGYFVKNQEKLYHYLYQQKYVIGIGDFVSLNTNTLKQAISECMKMKMFKHIDGKQTERIVNLFNSI